MYTTPSPESHQRTTLHGYVLALVGVCLLLAGVGWLLWLPMPGPTGERVLETGEAPTVAQELSAHTVARMDSPIFVYDQGWRVNAAGADLVEPADPWTTPSGTLTFTYTGHELALQLAPGDYWGYLYVTVDDEPATDLPTIRGNTDSRGLPAAYKPLYAPTTPAGDATGPGDARWLVVHRSGNDGPHTARIEVWRSWGQTPLRAVAVDALAAPGPAVWPGVLLLVSGALCLLAALVGPRARWPWSGRAVDARPPIRAALQACASRAQRQIAVTAIVGGVLAGVGIGLSLWWVALVGVGLLALAGLLRPALWLSAFLLALPFYFSVTIPLLPQRSFSIIDLGVLGGGVLMLAHLFLVAPARPRRRPAAVEVAATLLAGWALVSASAADHAGPALYEWRTVFLYGALFLAMVTTTLQRAVDTEQERRLLVTAWLAGATLMAAIALWQFGAGVMTITAEGVQRVRGLYGSPNNLALYLERALAVTLALALFLPRGRVRWLLAGATLIQGGALLLTFSKGALLLAVPAMLVVLWAGGLSVLRRQGRATTPLWALAGLATLLLLALLPFLGTERFQRVWDFSQGTGFLRVQLWRSSWQMAVDHALLGVGPDNFLYQYRSGYILPAAWQEPNLNHPHNWLLDWWTRLGVPGLVLGMSYWLTGIGTIWQSFRRARDGAAALLLGLLAASVAALAHGLIDVSYALPDLMLIWALIFGLALSLNPARRAHDTPETAGSAQHRSDEPIARPEPS